MKTANDQCHNTHQELILSNIVTESDIYDNYSYVSCVHWEIEKTPETHPEKLEFNIDKPETGLKKIDFKIIINNNEIDDIINNKMDYHSNNPTNDVYNKINHKSVKQEHTTYSILYRLSNSKL